MSDIEPKPTETLEELKAAIRDVLRELRDSCRFHDRGSISGLVDTYWDQARAISKINELAQPTKDKS